MLSKHTKKSWQSLLWRSLLIIVLTLITFIVVFIISNPIPLAEDATVITVIEKPKATVGLPIRLKIPIINVDAVIRYSGLTPDGAMDTIDSIIDVSWYEFGTIPGEIGSAVIAGHYGWFDGTASIFNQLHKLVKGDEVIVVGDNGKENSFIVQTSQKFDPNADATTVFQSDDNKAHLNLITCEGTWINSTNSYSDRLVIFTDKKEL